MGARATQLAKISRPQTYHALPRERLFARIDKARTHPVIWVSAPPGAGKTTMVVSYLETHGVGGLWYQVDRDDSDPATFCYFLGLAERRIRSRKRPLPLLTPEYLSDLAHYSRRLFRELFSRISLGQVLVLDNFQEVPDDSPFHELIEAGIQEVPDGINLIVISRVDPPQRYSRLVANQRIALLDWEAMKLTLEETQGIAALATRRDSGALSGVERGALIRMHEQSGGWCAGLVLLLEHARPGELIHGRIETDALHGIFDYFASQLFDRITAAQRDALLLLAFLPRMTPSAAREISGNPDAARLLDTLYRRHLFTDRRENLLSPAARRAMKPAAAAAESGYVYQFHALFRAFLNEQARTLLPADRIRATQRIAADLLRKSAHVEGAFDLFCEAADWDAARDLILAEAEKLIGEGRWKSLVGWIEQMPSEIAGKDPWLLYWMGVARIASEPSAARMTLEKSYEIASLRADRLCAIQSVAGIVETHVLEYTDLRACDRWLPILNAAFSEDIEFGSRESEARALAAFLNALVYRDPGNANIERYVERALSLFDSDLNLNLRTTLSVPLNYWGTNCGRLEIATHVISALEPVMENSEVTDLRKALFYYAAIHYYSFLVGESAKTMRIVQRMQDLAAETGFSFIGSWAAHCAGTVCARFRDIDGTQGWLRLIDQLLSERLHDRALRATKASLWLGACGGNPHLAREQALRSLELTDHVGLIPHQFFNLTSLLWAASEIQDMNELERWIAFSRQLSKSTRIDLYSPCILAAQAKAYCAIGDQTRGEAALRSVMDWAKSRNQGVCAASFLMPWMRDLCELALKTGIEVDFARKTIRENNYKPVSHDSGNWPWPVKIFTLGEFEIFLDDQPLRHSRKTPKRLLLLLKALIAQGAKEVPIEQLVDLLWAESEADTAHAAVSIAVRRLRILLECDEAILLKGGRLSLNREVCWVDSFAFERTLQSGGISEIEPALALYRGHFLRDETSVAWAFSRRDRLHARFVHHLNQVAKELEGSENWDAAERWYLRGLDIDDVAESFYQGLIRCHVARGNRSEARRVYERMGQRLTANLGMKPSAASSALYRDLLAE